MKKTEFQIIKEFSQKLGLENKTDGSLFLYKSKERGAKKPDGYYYFEGITFILDAKAEGVKFNHQLKNYMSLEANKNFIAFEYNGVDFKCYIQGRLEPDEKELKNKDYYKDKYFPQKLNNEAIVNKSAKKLANLFRDSRIDKQMNVPFIGAVILCMKFGAELNLDSTQSILRSIEMGINNIISDLNLQRRQKKEFIKRILGDSTLKRARLEDLFIILQEISNVYNFINISANDYKGHDIMNNFLKVFRNWNSINANEKGEVFTPDHIAQLMYKLAACSRENYILDPTCGSGTFLTNAMANMFNELFKSTQELETDKTSKAQLEIKENRLIGIESNEFNATLAGINMMLHGDGASNIYYDNCFSKLPSLRNLYDRVLMNPPFSQKDDELKFVYETLFYMKDGGVLASILPKSCVKGSIESNVEWIEKILKISHLLAVISLPRDLFYPVGADTCIIILHKSIPPKKPDTLLINCLNDGFRLSSDGRIDENNTWEQIENEILEAFTKQKYSEFRAIKKQLRASDELLFEAYSSHRPVDISREIFQRYVRENIAAKVLCGKELIKKELHKKPVNEEGQNYGRFLIKDLIYKICKGKEKSIDRKLEDKYDLRGIPLIIAKKDNNGIGGMKQDAGEIFENKICIVAGGDGGGGKTYFCDFAFCATSFIMVCDFVAELSHIDKYAKFYICIVISERLYKTIGHGRTIADIPSQVEIKLPIKTQENKLASLDFAFMKSFICSLPFGEFL